MKWSNQWTLCSQSIMHCMGNNEPHVLSERYCPYSDVFVVHPVLSLTQHLHTSVSCFFGTDSHFQYYQNFSHLSLPPSGLSASYVKWSLSNLNRSCEITRWSLFIWPSTLTEEHCNDSLLRVTQKRWIGSMTSCSSQHWKQSSPLITVIQSSIVQRAPKPPETRAFIWYAF